MIGTMCAGHAKRRPAVLNISVSLALRVGSCLSGTMALMMSVLWAARNVGECGSPKGVRDDIARPGNSPCGRTCKT
jgi:hypothetical protein